MIFQRRQRFHTLLRRFHHRIAKRIAPESRHFPPARERMDTARRRIARCIFILCLFLSLHSFRQQNFRVPNRVTFSQFVILLFLPKKIFNKYKKTQSRLIWFYSHIEVLKSLKVNTTFKWSFNEICHWNFVRKFYSSSYHGRNL